MGAVYQAAVDNYRGQNLNNFYGFPGVGLGVESSPPFRLLWEPTPCLQAATNHVGLSVRYSGSGSGIAVPVFVPDKRSKRAIYTTVGNSYYSKSAVTKAVLYLLSGTSTSFWDQEVACSNHVAPTIYRKCRKPIVIGKNLTDYSL